MNVSINYNMKTCFAIVHEKIHPITEQDGRIGWMAFIAIGTLAACYALYMVIKNFKRKWSKLAMKKDEQAGSLVDPKGNAQKTKLKVGRIQQKKAGVPNKKAAPNTEAANSPEPKSSRVRAIIGRYSKKPVESDPVKRERSPLPKSEGVTSGGSKALEAYKRDPSQCSKINRAIVFRDIKEIKSTPGKSGGINSVEGLMLYHSGLDRVDLQNERCVQVAVDTIKECNKETSGRLVEWLVEQKVKSTEILMTPDALRLCLEAFIEKHETQQINLYALEQLIKTYREKKWNEVVNDQGKLILPSNHHTIVSAMSLLIKEDPNNNRIGSLAEWMMGQKDFDLSAFTDWVGIFKQKELDNPEVADKLYYPLLNKLIAHFKEKWGQPMLSSLSIDVADFVRKQIN